MTETEKVAKEAASAEEVLRKVWDIKSQISELMDMYPICDRDMRIVENRPHTIWQMLHLAQNALNLVWNHLDQHGLEG